MNVSGFSFCSNGPVWLGISKYKIKLSYMILNKLESSYLLSFSLLFDTPLQINTLHACEKQSGENLV